MTTPPTRKAFAYAFIYSLQENNPTISSTLQADRSTDTHHTAQVTTRAKCAGIGAEPG